MKIAEIETVRVDKFPNLIWANAKTDQGLVGLGETFFGAAAVKDHLHNFIVPYLLEKKALSEEI